MFDRISAALDPLWIAPNSSSGAFGATSGLVLAEHGHVRSNAGRPCLVMASTRPIVSSAHVEEADHWESTREVESGRHVVAS